MMGQDTAQDRFFQFNDQGIANRDICELLRRSEKDLRLVGSTVASPVEDSFFKTQFETFSMPMSKCFTQYF